MEKELIKELWKLWEDLAITGELHVNKDFPNKYNELKKEVNKITSNNNCVRCDKHIENFDKYNNNCCDECWLSL